MALSEMSKKPLRHTHALCKTCKDWTQRLVEYECLFELGHSRVGEAIKHWQRETGQHHVHPDLGELMAWVMTKAGLGFDKKKMGLGKSDPKLHGAWRKKYNGK